MSFEWHEYEELDDEIEDPERDDEGRVIYEGGFGETFVPPNNADDDLWKKYGHPGDLLAWIDEGGDDPRDTPPPKIFGEIIDHEPKRPLFFVGGIMANQIVEVVPVLDKNGRPIVRNGKPVMRRGKLLWPPVHDHLGQLNRGSLSDLVKSKSKAPLPAPSTIYDPLFRFLEDVLNYKRGVNFFPFDYDWTRPTKESGKKFAGYIKRILDSHPEWEDADVICHSMGGLVTRAAQIFYKAPVNRTIYIASPHYGASKAYFALHPGVDIKFSDSFWKNLGIEALWKYKFKQEGEEDSLSKELKKAAKQIPAAYDLLPDKFYYDRQKWVVRIEHGGRRIIGWEDTYIDAAESRFPSKVMRGLAEKSMEYKLDLRKELPGKLNMILANRLLETLDTVEYDIVYPTGFEEPEDSGQHGDGTVPTKSAVGPGGAIAVLGEHQHIPNSRYTHFWIGLFLHSTS